MAGSFRNGSHEGRWYEEPERRPEEITGPGSPPGEPAESGEGKGQGPVPDPARGAREDVEPGRVEIPRHPLRGPPPPPTSSRGPILGGCERQVAAVAARDVKSSTAITIRRPGLAAVATTDGRARSTT